MKFGDPFYFHLLWALIPLLFFLIWGNRKKYELLIRFCGKPYLTNSYPQILENSKKLKRYV